MKIVALMENTSSRPGLSTEHGLSLYIETSTCRVLFDTGETGAFADNAAALGIDLSRVDAVVLSHGHRDHGGGLGRFLERNATAPVYLHPQAFLPHFGASGRDIGLDPSLQDTGRLLFLREGQQILPGLTLFSCNRRVPLQRADAFGQTVLSGGRQIPDPYRHELYLLAEDDGKRVCFSGCSHKGVVNIVNWLRPDILVGGFHFQAVTDCRLLTQQARALLAFPCRYYTCHCTGESQYAHLKEIMGHRLHRLRCGDILEI